MILFISRDLSAILCFHSLASIYANLLEQKKAFT